MAQDKKNVELGTKTKNKTLDSFDSDYESNPLLDLEESLDFDVYAEDIPILTESTEESSPINYDLNDLELDKNQSMDNILNFSGSDEYSADEDDSMLPEVEESEISNRYLSESDLDDILSTPSSNVFSDSEEDESISLSSDELGNITSEVDYENAYEDFLGENESKTDESDSEMSSFEDDSLLSDSQLDADIDDSETSSFFSDSEDGLGEESEEIDFDSENFDSDDSSFDAESGEDDDSSEVKSFFDESSEDDDSIALSPEELGNITDGEDFEEVTISNEADEGDQYFKSEEPSFDSETSEDDEISLSGDELDNILESGGYEEEDSAAEDTASFDSFEEDEAKSFFDEEPQDDDDSIALSPEELGNITAGEEEAEEISFGNSELTNEDEFDTSSEELPEFGDVSEDEDISLSDDELENILQTGEVEEVAEESFFDKPIEEDDESISLSPEELGNITALDEEDSFQNDEPIEELNLDEEMSDTGFLDSASTEDEEEISLSTDELENILQSGEAVTEESVADDQFDLSEEPSIGVFDEDTQEEDESITLSVEELSNITGEDDELGELNLNSFDGEKDIHLEDDSLESTASFVDDGDEDEEISLSGDELNNILESGGFTEEETGEDESSPVFENQEEEDESISLSPEELGNITGEMDALSSEYLQDEDSKDDFLIGSDSEDSDEYLTADELPDNSSFEETIEFDPASDIDEDNDISLSGDELNNILMDSEEATDNDILANTELISEEGFDLSPSTSDFGDDSVEVSLEDDELDRKYDAVGINSVSKDDFKKVMSHLDKLLGSLPDSYIKEFAASEYFDLYKKIMNELEL